MKKFVVSIHNAETLEELGMVCVEAESADLARSKGYQLIQHHKNLGRVDIDKVATVAVETYSLRPGDWD